MNYISNKPPVVTLTESKFGVTVTISFSHSHVGYIELDIAKDILDKMRNEIVEKQNKYFDR